jgi:hypothetical protein
MIWHKNADEIAGAELESYANGFARRNVDGNVAIDAHLVLSCGFCLLVWN